MTLAKDISIKILSLLEKSPVYQSDLTGVLNVKHDQRVAEGIRILLDEHKITRTRVVYKKGRTFLINLNGHKPKKHNPSAMLSNDIFSPCTGCHLDCNPTTCTKITTWISAP